MEVHREMPAVQLGQSRDLATQLFSRIALFEDELQEGLKSVFSSLKQDALKVVSAWLCECRHSGDNSHGPASTSSGM